MLAHNKLESDTCIFSFILTFDISHVDMKPAHCDMQSIKPSFLCLIKKRTRDTVHRSNTKHLPPDWFLNQIVHNTGGSSSGLLLSPCRPNTWTITKWPFITFNPTLRAGELLVSQSVQRGSALCLQSGHTQQRVHFAMTVFTPGVHKPSLPQALLPKQEETLGPHVLCTWKHTHTHFMFLDGVHTGAKSNMKTLPSLHALWCRFASFEANVMSHSGQQYIAMPNVNRTRNTAVPMKNTDNLRSERKKIAKIKAFCQNL